MRAARWPLLGVVAAILVLVGGSWYQAVVTPAYFSSDEPGHVGYVLAVQDGDLLPEIDDDIPLDGGGPELEARLANTSESRAHNYVAKSPPWPYVLAAGPAALSRALGLPGGALFGLRVTNLLGAAVAVAATYALGRELSGGDTRVGLVAAGTLAVLPYVGFDVALGMIDGIALAATTVTLAILARICRQGPERATVIALGLAAAAGAGIRAMSLVECAVACAIALGVVLWRRTVPVVWAALWLAVPAALTSGWYYVLNRVRYGDVTATELPRVHPRQAAGRLAGGRRSRTTGMWRAMVRVLVLRRGNTAVRVEPQWWLSVLGILLAIGLVGTVLLVGAGIVRSRRPRTDPPTPSSDREPPSALAWAAMAVFVLVNVGLVAEHVSNGGSPQIRYLMPSLPIVVVMVGQVAVRATRGPASRSSWRWPRSRCCSCSRLEDSFAERLPPGMDPGPIGPGWASGAGLVLAVVAGLTLVAVLATGRADGAADDDASVASDPRPEPAIGGRR